MYKYIIGLKTSTGQGMLHLHGGSLIDPDIPTVLQFGVSYPFLTQLISQVLFSDHTSMLLLSLKLLESL